MGLVDTNSSLRIAVLHGGDSALRSESLASGRHVASSLVQVGHVAMLIDPAGMHPKAVQWPAFDLCWLAIPSDPDAAWQKQLQALDIPHTGSGSEACQLVASRSAARQSFLRFDISTPPFVVLCRCVSPVEATARVASLGYPLLVRPDHAQSGRRARQVHNATELSAALQELFAADDRVLCERFLRGREFSVTLLGERPLPPMAGSLVDLRDEGAVPEPATLMDHERHQLEHTALLAASAVGAAGLVQVDLVLDQAGRPWVLEVNPVPSLAERSPAVLAARQAGMSMNDLCQWMVQDCLVAESLR